MTAPVVDDVDAVVFVPVMTPLVVRLVSVPTDVRLEARTFEARVAPVSVPAAAGPPPPALPLSFCIACRIVSVAATVPAPLT